jgi:CheY-like chemotaxis protein
MPEGGTLTINGSNIHIDAAGIPQNPDAAAGPYVVIEVADTGCGISPEIHKKVFEPFYTTKEVGRGTGLGLSTVAAIVRNHGGFINLYSEVGRGTSFKIYFPAMQDQAPALETNGRPALPGGNGELILLVDDEAAVRDIARITLETHGYQVVEARDGAEGVAMYAMHREDIRLVISDMDMPVMNGSSMIRSLERINPAVRVISASGLVNGSDLLPQKMDLGPIRVQLRKPYTAGELLRTVHDVLSA